jgi:hypothetical protein
VCSVRLLVLQSGGRNHWRIHKTAELARFVQAGRCDFTQALDGKLLPRFQTEETFDKNAGRL